MWLYLNVSSAAFLIPSVHLQVHPQIVLIFFDSPTIPLHGRELFIAALSCNQASVTVGELALGHLAAGESAGLFYHHLEVVSVLPVGKYLRGLVIAVV